MGEKRKPHYVFLLRKRGKKKSNKVELFHSQDFGVKHLDQYRLRVNGKWWPDNKKEYFTRTKIRKLMFKQIKRFF